MVRPLESRQIPLSNHAPSTVSLIYQINHSAFYSIIFSADFKVTYMLSENGFSPRLWGPHLWVFMHILSMNFPLVPTRAQSRAYYEFFRSLCSILPCAACRREFCLMVGQGPLRLTPARFMQDVREKPGNARKRLVKYIIDLHSKVNRRIGKPQRILNTRRAQWIQYYARMRSRS